MAIKKCDVEEALLDYLVENYQPTIECVEAAGKCDFHPSNFPGDKCPCQVIIEMRNAPPKDLPS